MAVGSAVDTAVRSAVRSAVDSANSLRRGYLAAIQQWYYSYLGGRFWSGWGSSYYGLASLTYFRDVVNLQLPPEMASRLAASEDIMSGGWLWMHRDFVIACEPPVLLSREDPNDRVRRLHSLSGPAIAWRDGTALWFIHGIQVTQDVVESPQSITPDRIRAERNAEVRRVMIDRFGATRYLRAINAKVRHEDKDQFGFARRLLEANIDDVEPMVCVEVVNSTPEPIGYAPDAEAAGVWVGNRWHKIYSRRADPKCKTTEEALKWTFKLPAKVEYKPLVET